MKEEYEIISHSQIKDLNVFIVEMIYRQPHLHREFEICMILSGEADVYSRREKLRFGPGDLMIFNPCQPHEIHALSENLFILSVQVATSFYKYIYPTITNLEFDKIPLSFTGGKKR